MNNAKDDVRAYAEWSDVAMPILRWVWTQEEAGETQIRLEPNRVTAVADQLGLPVAKLYLWIERLIDGGLLYGGVVRTSADRPHLYSRVRLTPQGLQQLKVWPTSEVDRVEVLELMQLMVSGLPADSPDRSASEKILAGIKELGKDTFVHVMGELAKMGVVRATGMT